MLHGMRRSAGRASKIFRIDHRDIGQVRGRRLRSSSYCLGHSMSRQSPCPKVDFCFTKEVWGRYLPRWKPKSGKENTTNPPSTNMNSKQPPDEFLVGSFGGSLHPSRKKFSADPQKISGCLSLSVGIGAHRRWWVFAHDQHFGRKRTVAS